MPPSTSMNGPLGRRKSKTENKAFIQGIEKFIETMRGNSYTAIFIAQPVSSVELNNITDGYESIYSMISSFEKAAWSYNESKSNVKTEEIRVERKAERLKSIIYLN